MTKRPSKRHRAFISPSSRSFDRQRICYSACCSLFFAAITCATPQSHRAWLAEGSKRRDETIQESFVTLAQIETFEGAAVEVAKDFVHEDKIDGVMIKDDVEWRRAEGYDKLANEMVELHGELQETLTTKQDTDRVQHLGHGVYVQHNESGLDSDANEINPVTITREESRSVVWHALDALKVRSNVCVTGQPGIGKTRGCMTYAIQALLSQGAAVLYVGYKSEEMLLFLPDKDCKYRVWSTRADKFSETFLALDKRVVAVIDPPEQGVYSARGKCRILMFASNNAKKHFDNWEKDGILLVTSMPTEKEVIAMTKVLWNEKITPHPKQYGKQLTLEEKIAEVEKRIELVGPIPRFVFNWKLYGVAINESLKSCEQAARDVSDSDLYLAFCGKYEPLLGKHNTSASSKLLFLSLEPTVHESWIMRRRKIPSFQLTPIATLVLCDRLLKVIDELRKDSFEDLAFDIVRKIKGCDAELQQRGKQMAIDGFIRICQLRSHDRILFRPSSKTFPMIDFALSISIWFDAKSVSPTQSKVRVRHKGALKFLRDLQTYMEERYTKDEIREILRREPPVLTIVTNRDVPVLLDKQVDLILCDVPVRLESMDVSQVASEMGSNAHDLLLRNRRTKELLSSERASY